MNEKNNNKRKSKIFYTVKLVITITERSATLNIFFIYKKKFI